MAKKKKGNWFFKLIFVLGFLILMYPQVSRLYYRVQSTQEVSAFDEGKAALSDEAITSIQREKTLKRFKSIYKTS
mgnify:CR=1 FL=1